MIYRLWRIKNTMCYIVHNVIIGVKNEHNGDIKIR